MSNLPKKCILDTNVPKIANLAVNPSTIPDNMISCVSACIDAVEHVVKNGGLVIDADNEIYTEYRKQLALRGQPGIGDRFMKWVHDNRGFFPDSDRVRITKNGNDYDEFPKHAGLNDFDYSDRKFVAVANAHRDKPPILQATDSKWWGWKDALADVGITVNFLCIDYVKQKYNKKMGA